MVRFPNQRLLLSLIIILISYVAHCGAQEVRPNILFIAVDDLRPWINYYGASWMKTPNIDRLAATSRVFNRHYVQVATCGATRHALLTGLRPSHKTDYGNGPFKVNKAELAARKTESLPHLFRQNGYRTFAIGKISHSNVSSLDDPPSWSGVTTLKRRWGDRHNFVNAYAQIERPASVHEPRNKGYAFESVPLDDKAYMRKLRHGYCAAVSYADAQVGKVLDELDRLNLSENTIVVLWGGHEAFGYHRPWHYVGNPYDSGPWAKTMKTDRYWFTRWTTEFEGGTVVQLELYDHWIDPGEQHNIAQRSPGLVKSLNARLGNDGRPYNP